MRDDAVVELDPASLPADVEALRAIVLAQQRQGHLVGAHGQPFVGLGVVGQLVQAAVELAVLVAQHFQLVAGQRGGTAVVAQKLLEAIFGDQAVRSLAATARRNLEERVTALLADERARYDAVLDEVGATPEVAGRLRAAAAEVEAQR